MLVVKFVKHGQLNTKNNLTKGLLNFQEALYFTTESIKKRNLAQRVFQ